VQSPNWNVSGLSHSRRINTSPAGVRRCRPLKKAARVTPDEQVYFDVQLKAREKMASMKFDSVGPGLCNDEEQAIAFALERVMSNLPSGTVTLFTDIEGSTQWWEQHLSGCRTFPR
jgi:class 3 adenylate cyclase